MCPAVLSTKVHGGHRDNVTHMKIRIRIGAVLLATTFLATFLTILLGCYPIKKHWQINPDPGSMYPFYRPKGCLFIEIADHCQPAISKLQVAVLITLNITTDFYLMSIPIPVGTSFDFGKIKLTLQQDDLEISPCT